ncbi:MAG: PTS sugar transporter subunit IIA [Victivallales bacterium]|jgi:mannitol/fructose-specific phosphotransferase system IIA component (Ntr-type)|nr:PTS sugar transporter subunit IIA [Victivallales bacterium]
MRLTEQITPSLIKIGLESEEKEELFEEMVQLLMDAGRVTDREAALEALFEREAKMTTGITRWIGLPHGKVEGIDGLIVALGVSKKGIEYDSLDEEPVYVVLMVLAEAGNPGPHIEALSEIARLFGMPGFTERIRDAETVNEVLELIRAEE